MLPAHRMWPPPTLPHPLHIRILVIPAHLHSPSKQGKRADWGTVHFVKSTIHRSAWVILCLLITMTSRTPVRLDPATGKKIPPPVSPKPVRMTATRLTRASVRPPPPPQPSSGMKSTEEELDALTDLLVKNLENTGDPDFFGEWLKSVVDVSPLFLCTLLRVLCTLSSKSILQFWRDAVEFRTKLFLKQHLPWLSVKPE